MSHSCTHHGRSHATSGLKSIRSQRGGHSDCHRNRYANTVAEGQVATHGYVWTSPRLAFTAILNRLDRILQIARMLQHSEQCAKAIYIERHAQVLGWAAYVEEWTC